MEGFIFWFVFMLSFLIPQSLGEEEKDDELIVTRIERELSRSSSFPEFQTQLKDDLVKVKKSFAEFQLQVTQDLGIIKKSLFLTHNANILDKRLDNCALSLSNGNEMGARKFWDSLRTQLLPSDEIYNLGSRILNKLELNNQTTIKTTLSFLGYIEYPEGFQMLFDKMKINNFVYNNSEIFILAHFYKQVCGVSRGIFPKLPYIVQDVISSAVQIKNVMNRGYLHGNGSGPENILTSRSRTSVATSLWVFSLTSEGQFIISNKYKNNTQLLDDHTQFMLMLVDDETFRIQVVKSERNPSIVGKYLAGKRQGNESGGHEFLPVQFIEQDYGEFEAMRWTVEDSLSLDNVFRKNCI